jgi:hypothetical protein
MNCPVTLEGYIEALERDGAGLRDHMASCAACRQHAAALDAADDSLRLLVNQSPPPHVVERTLKSMAATIESAGAGEIMTLDEVADFLKIPADDLELFVHELPAFELAGHIRVRRSQLMEWIERRERQHMRDVVHTRLLADFRAVSQGSQTA